MKCQEKISYYSIRTYVIGKWKYVIYKSIERPAITVEPLCSVNTKKDADKEIELLERNNE